MQRIRRVLSVAVLVLAALTYWSYRNTIALVEASEFKPTASALPLIPKGTEMRVVLSNGISEGSRAGDDITAFTLSPILVNGEAAIPAGLQLKGVVDTIEGAPPAPVHHPSKPGKPRSRKAARANVRIHFDEVVFNGKITPMETQPVFATTRITNDFKILGGVINTMLATGIGLGLTVGSEDRNLIVEGLGRGARNGVPGPTSKSAEVSVVLTQPLKIKA
jgi:hypothetical protein